MTVARHAHASEMAPIGATLARAFHDDPTMTWLFGDRDGPRQRRLRRFMRSEARRHLRRGGLVLTADGHPGAALWDPPGRWRITWADVARSGPMLLAAVGRRIPRALRGLELIDRTHPREPHWYLAVLGTDPLEQGKGVGAALIRPVLGRCDAEGLGAYLEASRPETVPYYERFAFRATGRIDLPDGPPLVPMWRDPR